jgi:hypothetical protein
MMKMTFVTLAALAGLVTQAQAQIGAPIGKPDNRLTVARLARALPPSLNGDYLGVTPDGRWCALSVASNGWEFYASIKVAVPGTPWSFGRPTMTTYAAGYELSMNINSKRVTAGTDSAELTSVSYEQIPVPYVNMQYLNKAKITITKNQFGRPSRVEIVDQTIDTWNNYVFERIASCGEPVQK